MVTLILFVYVIAYTRELSKKGRVGFIKTAAYLGTMGLGFAIAGIVLIRNQLFSMIGIIRGAETEMVMYQANLIDITGISFGLFGLVLMLVALLRSDKEQHEKRSQY